MIGVRAWIQDALDGMSPRQAEWFEQAVEAVERQHGRVFSVDSVWRDGYPARYGLVSVPKVGWLADQQMIECVRPTPAGRCFGWRWVT